MKGGTLDPRAKDVAGNGLSANVVWAFTTAAAPNCPCSGWSSSATPGNPSVADPGAVELGVKFRSDLSGYITGVRFYKGVETRNHHRRRGNLWTLNGQQLATAIFTGETATGWQQVNFATPVAITANTVYVASYYAPNGNYAGDSFYFANTGVDNAPVHLLRDGVSGGNGVYKYGAASTFPNYTYQATNYWVDVVFTTVPGGDTTPPTVTATSPNNGATAVNVATTVTATFSEALDPATINATTFELRDPGERAGPGNGCIQFVDAHRNIDPGQCACAGHDLHRDRPRRCNRSAREGRGGQRVGRRTAHGRSRQPLPGIPRRPP